MIPQVQTVVINDGARGSEPVQSGIVPLASIAPVIKEGETLWMAKSKDYRIQLKGDPKRVVGDQVLPEKARFAQFENYSFRCSDPETNKQLSEAAARGYDFWRMDDIEERAKAQKEAELSRMVESASPEQLERLAVVLGEKGFALPPRPKKGNTEK